MNILIKQSKSKIILIILFLYLPSLIPVQPIANPNLNQRDRENYEDTYLNLPDLYQRKYLLTEQIHQSRSNYITRVNQSEKSNLTIQRNLTVWDMVLEEIQWRAIDFKEERKFKMAIRSHISRKAKRQQSQKAQTQTELFYYHKYISNYICTKVLEGFQYVRNLKEEQKAIQSQQNPEIIIKNDTSLEIEEEQKQQQINQVELEAQVDPFKQINENSNILNFDQQMEEQNLRSKEIEVQKEKEKEALVMEEELNNQISIKLSNPNKEFSVRPQSQQHQNVSQIIKKMQELQDYSDYNQAVPFAHLNDLKRNFIKTRDRFKDFLLKPGNQRKDKEKIDSLFIANGYLENYQQSNGTMANGIQKINPMEQQTNEPLLGMPYKIQDYLYALETAKKKKKQDEASQDVINEQILNGFQLLNPSIDLKKNQYDNMNDLLVLFYDRQLVDVEYPKLFQKSLILNKDFYQSWDSIIEVPQSIDPYKEIYQPILFEKEFDNFAEDYFSDPDALLKNIPKMLLKFSPFGNDVLLTDEQVKSILNQRKVDSSHLIAGNLLSLPDHIFIKRDNYFVYPKYPGDKHRHMNSKFQIKNQNFILNESKILTGMINNPIVSFLMNYYMKIWGNKWSIISDQLTHNSLLQEYNLTEQNCQHLYLLLCLQRKEKFVNLEKFIYPSKYSITFQTELYNKDRELNQKILKSIRDIQDKEAQQQQNSNKPKTNSISFEKLHIKSEPQNPLDFAQEYENIQNDFQQGKNPFLTKVQNNLSFQQTAQVLKQSFLFKGKVTQQDLEESYNPINKLTIYPADHKIWDFFSDEKVQESYHAQNSIQTASLSSSNEEIELSFAQISQIPWPENIKQDLKNDYQENNRYLINFTQIQQKQFISERGNSLLMQYTENKNQQPSQMAYNNPQNKANQMMAMQNSYPNIKITQNILNQSSSVPPNQHNQNHLHRGPTHPSIQQNPTHMPHFPSGDAHTRNPTINSVSQTSIASSRIPDGATSISQDPLGLSNLASTLSSQMGSSQHPLNISSTGLPGTGVSRNPNSIVGFTDIPSTNTSNPHSQSNIMNTFGPPSNVAAPINDTSQRRKQDTTQAFPSSYHPIPATSNINHMQAFMTDNVQKGATGSIMNPPIPSNLIGSAIIPSVIPHPNTHSNLLESHLYSPVKGKDQPQQTTASTQTAGSGRQQQNDDESVDPKTNNLNEKANQ